MPISRFCELYHHWRHNQDVVLRQDHPAGEKMFVDWAGDTMALHEPTTGEITPALKVFQSADVAIDPVRQVLAEGGASVGIAAGAQDGDKQGRRTEAGGTRQSAHRRGSRLPL